MVSLSVRLFKNKTKYIFQKKKNLNKIPGTESLACQPPRMLTLKTEHVPCAAWSLPAAQKSSRDHPA